MEQYRIENNLVFTKQKMLAIYQLEPIDLVILPEQEQEAFEMDMHRMLNSLQQNNIQIIMRTRKAIPTDFEKHFSSLRKLRPDNATVATQGVKSRILNDYVSQLSELLIKNIIPVKEYFIIFSEPANRSGEINKILPLLERQINRVAMNFKRAGIALKQLEENQLIKLFSEFTRP